MLASSERELGGECTVTEDITAVSFGCCSLLSLSCEDESASVTLFLRTLRGCEAADAFDDLNALVATIGAVVVVVEEDAGRMDVGLLLVVAFECSLLTAIGSMGAITLADVSAIDSPAFRLPLLLLLLLDTNLLGVLRLVLSMLMAKRMV